MKLCATALPLFAFLSMLTAVRQTASGASFEEPPLVVHGKVVKLGLGGGFQLFSGNLRVTLVNQQNPSHVLDFNIPLRKAGSNGEFSYRLEIDQETQPDYDELASTLVVGSGKARYTIKSATVNGFPARSLDPEQAAEVSTSFANRGEELRLDFRTDIPTPDTDGDGIPDWWEELYGLSHTNGGDALVDADGDGWSNLKEFQLSTDPLTANYAPVLQNSLLVVTSGGSNGAYLPIADADTPPEKLKLTLLGSGNGLVWKRAGAGLALGDSFSYADLLAGRISVDVAASFTRDTVRLRLEDLSTAGVVTQEISVIVEAFAPNRRWLGDPVVWLDAGSVTQAAPLAEWTDRSAYQRDGYQPYAEARPVADGRGHLSFHGAQYLFVDDRELTLGQFVALLTFELDSETQSDQTLFCSSDLEISIGGTNSGIHGRSIKVVQDGRTIHGPVVDVQRPLQLTLESSPSSAELRIPGMGSFRTRTVENAPLASFTTVGARYPFSATEAENYFNGSLREVLIYNRAIHPETRGFLEDYQLARWQGVRIWNQRGSSQPVMITGSNGVRNSICGGECNDTLAGAEQSDILRGGTGSNRLTGKAGADHFVFAKTGGNDVITDFSAASGDIIDLTEIFAGKTGLPSNFVKFTTLVTRGADNIPRVDTRLDLIYEGTGTVASQAITLQGVGFGSSDLARLLGEGNLQLGGPRFDSSVTLAVSSGDRLAPGLTRKLTLLRSGNASGAVEVPLSFSGTARMDLDYRVTGATGTGSVRRVTFARGSATASVDIVPLSSRSGDDMTLVVTALPVPQVNDGGAQIEFGIPATSTFTIQTTSHIHEPLGRNGSVRVSRRGGMDQAIDLSLAFGGTLIGGINYQPIASVLHFAAGEDSRSFAVVPMGNAPAGVEMPKVSIGISPAPLRYATAEPADSAVYWLTRGTMNNLMSYAEWLQVHCPEGQGAIADLLDGDNDGKSNLFEYLTGGDPLEADGLPFDFMMAPATPGYELRWKTGRVLTDMRIEVEESGDFMNWSRTPRIDGEVKKWTPDGRIQHNIHLKPAPTPGNRYFRLRPIPIAAD